MKKIYLLVLFVVQLTLALDAQDKMPDTDIYLLNIKSSKDAFSFTDWINITDRPGYDNQPAFLPDGSGVLYTSIHDDGQADIYEYIIATKATAQLTRTSVSEYSPEIVPGGKAFTVVMVEKDSTQRIWKYMFGYTDPQIILPNIDSIGYYCWANRNILGLFILTNPPTLEIADIRSGKHFSVAQNIGRCIQKIPEKNSISFVQKDSDSTQWKIKELDLKTNGISTIVNTLEGSEDYVWTPDGVLLMGKGTKLYRYEPKVDTEWEPIVDFSSLKIKGFYRLAISDDGSMLAIVAFKNNKP